MPRISLVEESQAPLGARPFYANGNPGPIFSSMAHVPEVLATAAPFIATIFGESAVSNRLKEIVVLRTSAKLGCRYCIQTHTAVALGAGLSRDEVVALRGEGPAEEVFSDPAERALRDWSDALADGASPVSDEMMAAVREYFSEPEVVELTLLAGATLMLNRYCTALSLPASAGTLAKLESENLS